MYYSDIIWEKKKKQQKPQVILSDQLHIFSL